jgi:hypothetical protein
MTDPRENIRRLVGNPLSNQKRWGHTMPSKHYNYKARLRGIPPTPPVPCMFYVEGNIGRVCGDHDSGMWSGDVALLCAQEGDGEVVADTKKRPAAGCCEPFDR